MKKLSIVGISLGMACALATFYVWNAHGQSPVEVVEEDWDDEDLDVYTQRPEEALDQDLELVADAKGWTFEEAVADHKAAEEVGRIAEELAAKRPDIFIGSAVSDEPGGMPILYVKGPAGPDVFSLVDSAEIEIDVADEQPFSFLELEARQKKVHLELEKLGFKSIATAFRLEEAGQIRARVTVESDLPDSRSEILQSLPMEQADYVHLTLRDTPVFERQHAYGGMRAKIGSTPDCTTGWTVTGNAVTTAGHCSGITKIDTPGTDTHNFPFGGEHRGAYGDVEWHTSSTTEEPKFYATSSVVRWTMSLEGIRSLSEGESICVYGRFSNDRDCSLDVETVSVADYIGGVWTERMVEMDGSVTIGGDSGGGWSFGTRAYGSHIGDGATSVFSAAAYFNAAIGKSVVLACPGECTPGDLQACTAANGNPGTETCETWCRWRECQPNW